jgi:hypothetical protein
MPLKVGSKLRSAVCSTEVIVVTAPKDDVDITCGGTPMLGPDAEAAAAGGAPAAGADTGNQLGKRYASEDLGLELLVTKAGQGTLAVNGEELPIKAPKTLPASD